MSATGRLSDLMAVMWQDGIKGSDTYSRAGKPQNSPGKIGKGPPQISKVFYFLTISSESSIEKHIKNLVKSS